jgi:RPA family protein
MATEQKPVERQTAKICSIKELNNGKYVKQEGWEPNYVLTSKNEKVSRANIIGVAVTISDNASTIFIDDGTGKIELRSFENPQIFKDITIGDIVLIIGRPREFNNQIYINCEILKKISNKGWLEYRKKEIILKNIKVPDVEINENLDEPVVNQEKQQDMEEVDEIEDILLKIKNLDTGNGCNVEDLASLNPNAEKIIQMLMMKGDIFEISPGKVKILE